MAVRIVEGDTQSDHPSIWNSNLRHSLLVQLVRNILFAPPRKTISRNVMGAPQVFCRYVNIASRYLVKYELKNAVILSLFRITLSNPI